MNSKKRHASSSSDAAPVVTVHEQAQRKRDNIIRQASSRSSAKMPEVSTSGYEQALALFDDYLVRQQKKRTPERLFILRQIYQSQTPIDIQTLHQRVCDQQGLVSLTTVYNNLNLLIDARLVRKLDLVGGHMSFFEKVIGQEYHGFIICDQCGSIRPFTDPLMTDLQQKLPRGFKYRDITLQIHGICHKCDLALRRKSRSV